MHAGLHTLAFRTLVLILAVITGGCAYQRDESAVILAQRGQFAAARDRVAANATDKPVTPTPGDEIVNSKGDALRSCASLPLSGTVKPCPPSSTLSTSGVVSFASPGANRAAVSGDTRTFADLLTRVPTMSRTVFNLFAIDGFSHAEIAEMLGLSEGTTKWHVSHARTVLRSAIAGEAMARTEKTASR